MVLTLLFALGIANSNFLS